MRTLAMSFAGAFWALSCLPSSAAPAAPLPSDTLSRSDLTLVAGGCGVGGHRARQGFCVFNRGRWGRSHYPRYGGYRHGPRYGYRHYPRYGVYDRHDDSAGAAAAAGIAGLAAGAILGGVLSQSQTAAPVYGEDTTAYCMRRFKSYDPASGTYLGYDGVRHPCP